MKMLKNCRFSPDSIVIILLVAALGFWSYTQAIDGTISACIRTDGSMYVIGDVFRFKKCKSTEQSYSWNIQGPKGEKGDKGEQGLQGEKGETGPAGKDAETKHLHAVDGSGQDLGILLGLETHESPNKIYHLLSDTGRMLSIKSISDLGRIELLTTQIATIYFEKPDCMGIPYINGYSKSPNLDSMIEIVIDGENRFFRETTDTGSIKVVNSYNDGINCRDTATTYQSIFSELEETGSPFQKPLTWPITIVEK